LQNAQDRTINEVDHDPDEDCFEHDFLAQSPVCANGNAVKDLSKAADLTDLVMVGSINETSPTLETRPTGSLSEISASNLGPGNSPLLVWLDQTIPTQNSTTVHRRRQEQMDLQGKAKTEEMD
jgi:hypothetical protein